MLHDCTSVRTFQIVKLKEAKHEIIVTVSSRKGGRENWELVKRVSVMQVLEVVCITFYL